MITSNARIRNDGTDAERFLILYPGDSDSSAKMSQQLQILDRATPPAEHNLASEVFRGSKAFLYYFSISTPEAITPNLQLSG